jgi:hypothetical protein
MQKAMERLRADIQVDQPDSRPSYSEEAEIQAEFLKVKVSLGNPAPGEC